MIKNKSLIPYLLLLTIFILSTGACQSGALSSEEIQETAAEADFLNLVDTAVFETTVVDRLTAWAPTATLTHTPTPTITLTPIPSLTPTITPTVYKNPWVLQGECVTEDPSPCIGYSVHNTDAEAWVNIQLTYQITGEEGMFSIAPKSTGTITLLPGEYSAIFSASCAGDFSSITKVTNISARTDTLYCSTGMHDLRFK